MTANNELGTAGIVRPTQRAGGFEDLPDGIHVTNAPLATELARNDRERRLYDTPPDVLELVQRINASR